MFVRCSNDLEVELQSVRSLSHTSILDKKMLTYNPSSTESENTLPLSQKRNRMSTRKATMMLFPLALFYLRTGPLVVKLSFET